MLKIKRAYDKKATADGKRILIDRLWPRGLSKAEAGIDEWLKELAPSTELRGSVTIRENGMNSEKDTSRNYQTPRRLRFWKGSPKPRSTTL